VPWAYAVVGRLSAMKALSVDLITLTKGATTPQTKPNHTQINYTDEFVNFLRLTYYTVQLGTLLLAYIVIRNKVSLAGPAVPSLECASLS
jgi:hypothetical protein